MRKFGLIGRNIDYSFSREYFKEKFKNEKITDATYVNFDLEVISLFDIQTRQTPNLSGCNVTIPYKETIIPYLDKLNKTAKKIGAVNTIKVSKKGKFIGYNTDYYGFKKTLQPHLKKHHKKALILGTGGASKAVAYALKQLNIKYSFVSRTASKQSKYTYNTLSVKNITKHTILINCTPLGTHPDVDACPNIPYEGITDKHILFDLIYNPEETIFLSLGKQLGATAINGYKMLELQAEKSWRIWNK